MSQPQISAIICTYNRETYLGTAIDSLLSQDFAAPFEVIVVDNASTDNTRAVIETRLTRSLPSHLQLHYIYEPVNGLSVARNTGAKAAQSSLLAYLDDDAVASPTWLQAIYTAYQHNEKLAVAGGKVTLLWSYGTSA
ncbi:MAG TPA: glycosyltransferase family A protein, partial [Allocoleopsis sp.]